VAKVDKKWAKTRVVACVLGFLLMCYFVDTGLIFTRMESDSDIDFWYIMICFSRAFWCYAAFVSGVFGSQAGIAFTLDFWSKLWFHAV
jgi:hypothetical protein